MPRKSANTPFKILAIDVGNTNIHAGIVEKTRGRIKTSGTFAFPPKEVRTSAGKPSVLKKLLDAAGSIHGIYASSVNPNNFENLAQLMEKNGYARPVLLGKDLRIPIVNNTRRPRDVGTDRLLNALAAFHILKRACIVIDSGTALNFDVVDDDGVYLGGVLAPGIRTSIRGLARATALLPEFEIHRARRVLGRDTISALNSGHYWGTKGLITFIVEKLDEELDAKHALIVTGGDARIIAADLPLEVKIVADLTLRGIYLAVCK